MDIKLWDTVLDGDKVLGAYLAVFRHHTGDTYGDELYASFSLAGMAEPFVVEGEGVSVADKYASMTSELWSAGLVGVHGEPRVWARHLLRRGTYTERVSSSGWVRPGAASGVRELPGKPGWCEADVRGAASVEIPVASLAEVGEDLLRGWVGQG